MQRTFIMLLLLCLLFAGAAGCAAVNPAEPESEQEEAAEEPVADAGIRVSGTVVGAAGKQVDLPVGRAEQGCHRRQPERQQQSGVVLGRV